MQVPGALAGICPHCSQQQHRREGANTTVPKGGVEGGQVEGSLGGPGTLQGPAWLSVTSSPHRAVR